MKKKFVFLSLVVFFLFPVAFQAHVKWFTKAYPEKIAFEEVLNGFFLSFTIICAFLIAVVSLTIRKFENHPLVESILKYKPDSVKQIMILKLGTAGAFIIQMLSGTLFAPEFPIGGIFIKIGISFVVILFLIPRNFFTKLAAILLCIIYFVFVHQYGLFHMLDYSFYLGLILYMLLINTRWDQYKSYSLFSLTGFSLCWLAAEKWIYPGLTLNIIELYELPTLGFDPALFTAIAAFIEFTIGFAWIIGVLNRLLSVIFATVITLTTLLFGWTEFVGHILIYFILFTFITGDSITYKAPINMYKSNFNQFVFVMTNYFLILSTIILVYYRFA